MTRQSLCLPVAAAAGLWLALAPVAWAHNALKAVVVVMPAHPRVGEACEISLSVLAPPGVPILRQIQRVSLAGEMTGHAMAPVETVLVPSGGPGGYSGRLAFTMAGDWRATLRVALLNEEMWATFDMEVWTAHAPPDTGSGRVVLEMRDPVRTNLLPPGWVLAGAVGLTLLAEGTAAALKLRRSRKGTEVGARWRQTARPAHPPAPGPASRAPAIRP